MPIHHPTIDDAPWTAQAYTRGRDAATCAASWTCDGNTPDDHRRRMLAWLDDGDDRARDYLPREPDLSGEWSDDPSPASLYREITGRDESNPADGLCFETRHGYFIDAMADAFERGVSDYFMDACVRELRAGLPELI